MRYAGPAVCCVCCACRDLLSVLNTRAHGVWVGRGHRLTLAARPALRPAPPFRRGAAGPAVAAARRVVAAQGAACGGPVARQVGRLEEEGGRGGGSCVGRAVAGAAPACPTPGDMIAPSGAYKTSLRPTHPPPHLLPIRCPSPQTWCTPSCRRLSTATPSRWGAAASTSSTHPSCPWRRPRRRPRRRSQPASPGRRHPAAAARCTARLRAPIQCSDP